MILPGENEIMTMPINPGIPWYNGIKNKKNLLLVFLNAGLSRFCRSTLNSSAIVITITNVTVFSVGITNSVVAEVTGVVGVMATVGSVVAVVTVVPTVGPVVAAVVTVVLTVACNY